MKNYTNGWYKAYYPWLFQSHNWIHQIVLTVLFEFSGTTDTFFVAICNIRKMSRWALGLGLRIIFSPFPLMESLIKE